MRGLRYPALVGVALSGALVASDGRGEDRASVLGSYFRETSTRVVQPMVEVTKDLPAGYNVGAHFLVDAITSASIAAGTSQDNIFTELRKEVGVEVGKAWGTTHADLAYRESREPDYVSHTAGVSLSQEVWDRSGVVSLRFARGRDAIGPNLNRSLDVTYGGLVYTQALSPTAIVLIGYETTFLHGYQANPYIQVPNLGYEKQPTNRVRHVVAGRGAYFLPQTGTGLQLRYRFYIDSWGVLANTVEGRVTQEVLPGLDVRLGYRLHRSSAADFWCNTDPSRGGRTDCYGFFPTIYTADAKLGPLTTHYPEVKVMWDARPLAAVPVVGWLAAGEFEISYGRYFQDTHYADANLLMTGYTLVF
jgi:hypothetical protein